MPHLMSMVLFSGTPRLDGADIRRDLAKNWPALPASADVEETKDNTLAFRLGDADVIIAVMSAPVPWSDLEGPCATSILWPDAAAALEPHKTHAIVVVTGEADPVALSKLLTQATASVMATSPEALGVYWCNALLVVPKEMFIDFAVEVLPTELPLPIWVDFRVMQDGPETCMGFTTGMGSLGHMEFETSGAPAAPRALYDQLVNLAYYVLENGPVLQHGHTVGQDEHDRAIRIVHGASLVGHEGEVIRLEYGRGP